MNVSNESVWSLFFVPQDITANASEIVGAQGVSDLTAAQRGKLVAATSAVAL
jgi:hypothetical protein